MTLNNFKIREIQPEDNSEIAITIRKILIEFGVPKVGTAYADTVLDSLYDVTKMKKPFILLLKRMVKFMEERALNNWIIIAVMYVSFKKCTFYLKREALVWAVK